MEEPIIEDGEKFESKRTRLDGTDSASASIARVKFTHDGIIDAIIASPGISQGELAKMYGYTQPWISRVINSDAFQEMLAKRKSEIVDPTLVASIEEKLNEVASNSLDLITKRLGTGVISTQDAIKMVEVSTKCLGFGARDNTPVQNNSFIVNMPTAIPKAEDWAEQYDPNKALIEGESICQEKE